MSGPKAEVQLGKMKDALDQLSLKYIEIRAADSECNIDSGSDSHTAPGQDLHQNFDSTLQHKLKSISASTATFNL